MTSSSTNWWWFPPLMLMAALAAIGLVSLVENRRAVRDWWREISYRANDWLADLYQEEMWSEPPTLGALHYVWRPGISDKELASRIRSQIDVGRLMVIPSGTSIRILGRRPYDWERDGDAWSEAG